MNIGTFAGNFVMKVSYISIILCRDISSSLIEKIGASTKDLNDIIIKV